MPNSPKSEPPNYDAAAVYDSNRLASTEVIDPRDGATQRSLICGTSQHELTKFENEIIGMCSRRYAPQISA
jgi:hypothetical protein